MNEGSVRLMADANGKRVTPQVRKGGGFVRGVRADRFSRFIAVFPR